MGKPNGNSVPFSTVIELKNSRIAFERKSMTDRNEGKTAD
jgi:hypothetical protein